MKNSFKLQLFTKHISCKKLPHVYLYHEVKFLFHFLTSSLLQPYFKINRKFHTHYKTEVERMYHFPKKQEKTILVIKYYSNILTLAWYKFMIQLFNKRSTKLLVVSSVDAVKLCSIPGSWKFNESTDFTIETWSIMCKWSWKYVNWHKFWCFRFQT